MNYQTRARAYRENSVMGMSREHTVPLMYEHLLVGLKRASKHIREKHYEGKAASVEMASGILCELLASLNFDEGGEVLTSLHKAWVDAADKVKRGGIENSTKASGQRE